MKNLLVMMAVWYIIIAKKMEERGVRPKRGDFVRWVTEAVADSTARHFLIMNEDLDECMLAKFQRALCRDARMLFKVPPDVSDEKVMECLDAVADFLEGSNDTDVPMDALCEQVLHCPAVMRFLGDGGTDSGRSCSVN